MALHRAALIAAVVLAVPIFADAGPKRRRPTVTPPPLAFAGQAVVIIEKRPSGPPVLLSATARVVEAGLQSIEDLGSGQNPRYRWTWRVHFVGLGGSYGADEAADVGILTNSATALPGTVTRCTAYRDYVDAMPGSHNTIGALGCDILAYAVTTPL